MNSLILQALADLCDERGLYKVANQLDAKLATELPTGEMPPPEISDDDDLFENDSQEEKLKQYDLNKKLKEREFERARGFDDDAGTLYDASIPVQISNTHQFNQDKQELLQDLAIGLTNRAGGELIENKSGAAEPYILLNINNQPVRLMLNQFEDHNLELSCKIGVVKMRFALDWSKGPLGPQFIDKLIKQIISLV